MTDRFPVLLPEILRHEGGYVDHPKDPGGATNLGVTIGTLGKWLGRAATKAEVKALTPKTVAPIYREFYWEPSRSGRMWPGLDLVCFDAAVNSGVSRGVRWVQKAVGAAQDGQPGPKTLAAVAEAGKTLEGRVGAVQRACAARMGFLQGLRHWSTFGRGWSRRVAEVEARAVKDAGADVKRLEAETAAAGKKATRETSAATGTGAAGGGGVSLAEIPLEVALGLGVVILVLVFFFAWRARHDRDRAAAYESVLREREIAA